MTEGYVSNCLDTWESVCLSMEAEAVALDRIRRIAHRVVVGRTITRLLKEPVQPKLPTGSGSDHAQPPGTTGAPNQDKEPAPPPAKRPKPGDPKGDSLTTALADVVLPESLARFDRVMRELVQCTCSASVCSILVRSRG